MRNFIRDFVCDESGAAAAEYALILAIVGAGVGTAAWYLGGKISESLSGTADEIATCSTTDGAAGC